MVARPGRCSGAGNLQGWSPGPNEGLDSVHARCGYMAESMIRESGNSLFPRSAMMVGMNGLIRLRNIVLAFLLFALPFTLNVVDWWPVWLYVIIDGLIWGAAVGLLFAVRLRTVVYCALLGIPTLAAWQFCVMGFSKP